MCVCVSGDLEAKEIWGWGGQGTSKHRQVRWKLKKTRQRGRGKKGGMMDAGGEPVAPCQHLHASFQTTNCAAICPSLTLPLTHTEEICEIISDTE